MTITSFTRPGRTRVMSGQVNHPMGLPEEPITMVCMQPNIAHVVEVVSKYISNPRKMH